MSDKETPHEAHAGGHGLSRACEDEANQTLGFLSDLIDSSIEDGFQ